MKKTKILACGLSLACALTFTGCDSLESMLPTHTPKHNTQTPYTSEKPDKSILPDLTPNITPEHSPEATLLIPGIPPGITPGSSMLPDGSASPDTNVPGVTANPGEASPGTNTTPNIDTGRNYNPTYPIK